MTALVERVVWVSLATSLLLLPLLGLSGATGQGAVTCCGWCWPCAC